MADIALMNTEINQFCGTKGIDYFSEERGLSNLFKYAVPKLFELGKGISLGYTTFIGEELNHWYAHILSCDFTGGYLEGTDKKDPAEAFGQALLKLIKAVPTSFGSVDK